ncbi:MAG: hypothetical protein M3137_13965, partial [Actinomycetota bacterium]|nr:hypothetical protein [Actinomycetota bacterium]
MGKASSNKKVARAAGTGGGRTAGGRIAWQYYGVLLVVAVLGITGTVISRDSYHARINAKGGTPPTVGTTWNEGYAVYVCGKFLPSIKLSKDPNGITTQGDGIIHIHPTTKSAAGKNATLGKFASSVSMKLNAGELQVPGGTLYRDGNQCNGKTAHVYVKQFAFAGSTTGQVQNTDPRNVLLQDQALVTIAFVPNGQQGSIPAPPSAVQTALQKLAPPSTPGAAPTPGAPTPVAP